MDSIQAITNFKNFIGYRIYGTGVLLLITAYKDACTIYKDVTECYIYDDVNYGQLRITIEWCIDDEVIKGLGLHRAYNTNFQRMYFDGEKLSIYNDNIEIVLEKMN